MYKYVHARDKNKDHTGKFYWDILDLYLIYAHAYNLILTPIYNPGKYQTTSSNVFLLLNSSRHLLGSNQIIYYLPLQNS